MIFDAYGIHRFDIDDIHIEHETASGHSSLSGKDIVKNDQRCYNDSADNGHTSLASNTSINSLRFFKELLRGRGFLDILVGSFRIHNFIIRHAEKKKGLVTLVTVTVLLGS